MSKTNKLLEYKSFGQGKPIILLHGLFGSKENLGMVARPLAKHFQVIAVDLRNHGKSFHADQMDYPTMAQDVLQLLAHLQLNECIILGHSMGGKVAMQLALLSPKHVEKLVIADIAPVDYNPHHQQIIQGLQRLNTSTIATRTQADEQLANFEPDAATRQFLLTNLQRDDNKQLRLRLNIEAIANNQQSLCTAISGTSFEGPTLFIKGENSNYIKTDYLPNIAQLFPNYQLEQILNAGHMVHAEQSTAFNTVVKSFLIA